MIQLNQFTFYRSYYEAIQGLKSPKLRCLIYETMFNYVLNGIEPDPETNTGTAATIFLINKPHLDASRRKALNAMSKGKQADSPEQVPPPAPDESPRQLLSSEKDQIRQRLLGYR